MFKHLDAHLFEVIKQASRAFVVKSFGAVLRFAFQVLLARMLNAEGVGIFLLALSASQIASVFGLFGVDYNILRITASNASQGKWDYVVEGYQKSLLMVLTLSSCVTIAIAIAAPWLAHVFFSKPELVLPIRLMGYAIIPFSLVKLYAQLLQAIKHTSASVALEGVGIPIANSVLLVLLILPFGLNGACAAYVFSVVLVTFAGQYLWRRSIPSNITPSAHFSTRRLLVSSVPFFWFSLTNILKDLSDIVLVGIWLNSSEVGIYGVAKRITLLLSFILMAVNSIAAPKFAALFSQKEHAALGNLARNTTILTCLAAIPIFLFLYLAPQTVLRLFGEGFVNGVGVLKILAIGQFINVAAGPVEFLLMMTGHERQLRNNVVLSMLFGVILLLLLVPSFGLLGAAFASACALILENLTCVWVAYRRLNILVLPIPSFSRWQHKN